MACLRRKSSFWISMLSLHSSVSRASWAALISSRVAWFSTSWRCLLKFAMTPENFVFCAFQVALNTCFQTIKYESSDEYNGSKHTGLVEVMDGKFVKVQNVLVHEYQDVTHMRLISKQI